MRSIRLQLTVVCLSTVLLIAVIAAACVCFLFVWNAEASTHEGLTLQSPQVNKAMRFHTGRSPLELFRDRSFHPIYEGAPDDRRYSALNAKEGVLNASERNFHAFAPAGQVFDPAQATTFVPPDGVLTVSPSTPVQVARSERLQMVSRQANEESALKMALWAIAVSLIILGAAGYLALQRALWPLREILEATALSAAGNFPKLLGTAGLPTELKPLVEAFNMALERLEHEYCAQREFLSKATCEIKKPLSLMRPKIEPGREPDQTSLIRGVNMMARQVHQLLDLAEVSDARSYDFQPTSMASLVSEATWSLNRLASMRHVALQMSLSMEGGVLIYADRSATFVMLKNLVENAIRHSLPEGTVTVAIEATRLHVQDSGSGIAEAVRPKLFSRFSRGANKQNSGAGLGLAICQQIATIHGWSITARNVTPGARFTVNFKPRVTAQV